MVSVLRISFKQVLSVEKNLYFFLFHRNDFLRVGVWEWISDLTLLGAFFYGSSIKSPFSHKVKDSQKVTEIMNTVQNFQTVFLLFFLKLGERICWASICGVERGLPVLGFVQWHFPGLQAGMVQWTWHSHRPAPERWVLFVMNQNCRKSESPEALKFWSFEAIKLFLLWLLLKGQNI